MVARARLDREGSARPLTRLVAHVRVGDCVGPGNTTPFALEDIETRERIRLAPRQDSLRDQLRDLRDMATQLGMYDAADFLTRFFV